MNNGASHRSAKTERHADRKRERETVDYSASGKPVAAEPPIDVGADELLQRLREGSR